MLKIGAHDNLNQRLATDFREQRSFLPHYQVVDTN